MAGRLRLPQLLLLLLGGDQREGVDVPGYEGLQGVNECFKAGQRRTWAVTRERGLVSLDVRQDGISRRAKGRTWKGEERGVGVPGCEGPSTRWTHFQAGQIRRTCTAAMEEGGWCAWM